jgi:hypothetical protein
MRNRKPVTPCIAAEDEAEEAPDLLVELHRVTCAVLHPAFGRRAADRVVVAEISLRKAELKFKSRKGHVERRRSVAAARPSR